MVLDEGHVVRNPNALQSKAVLALRAERKWILSGQCLRITPAFPTFHAVAESLVASTVFYTVVHLGQQYEEPTEWTSPLRALD